MSVFHNIFHNISVYFYKAEGAKKMDAKLNFQIYRTALIPDKLG